MSNDDPCRCEESVMYRETLMSVAQWLSETWAQKSWEDTGATATLVEIQRTLRSWSQDGDEPIPTTQGR